MRQPYLFILFFVFSLGNVHSQDSLKKHSPVKLYSLSAGMGFWFTGHQDLLTINDYKKLAPDNSLMKNSLMGYTVSTSSEGPSSGGASLNCGFLFYDKKKKNYNNRYQLSLGFIYYQKTESGLSFMKRENVRFDTLKSNHSSDLLLIDTLKVTGYDYSLTNDNYFVDISFTTHSKQNRILSFYLGMNLSVGWSVNQNLLVHYFHHERFVDQNDRKYDYAPGVNSDISLNESTKLKMGNVFIGSIPLGGLIRFSRTKKGFVSHFALNPEVKAGLKVQSLHDRITYVPFANLNFEIKYFFRRESILKNYRPPYPFY